jgi:hypothetical protein
MGVGVVLAAVKTDSERGKRELGWTAPTVY